MIENSEQNSFCDVFPLMDFILVPKLIIFTGSAFYMHRLSIYLSDALSDAKNYAHRFAITNEIYINICAIRPGLADIERDAQKYTLTMLR